MGNRQTSIPWSLSVSIQSQRPSGFWEFSRKTDGRQFVGAAEHHVAMQVAYIVVEEVYS